MMNSTKHYQRFIEKYVVVNKLVFMASLMVLLTISCSSTEKEKSAEPQAGWSVVIKGKVNSPQQGQIVIQEMVNGSPSWQDTITLKKDNTFSKKVFVSQPNFFK